MGAVGMVETRVTAWRGGWPSSELTGAVHFEPDPAVYGTAPEPGAWVLELRGQLPARLDGHRVLAAWTWLRADATCADADHFKRVLTDHLTRRQQRAGEVVPV